MQEITEQKIAVCAMCIHYANNGKCLAFPDGIPIDILRGKNDHSKPIPDQGNYIVFEPI